MKAQKLLFFIILSFLFISPIQSLSNLQLNLLHDEHELPIVCTLEDGGLLAFTSYRGTLRQSKMTRFDGNANPVFHNITMNFDFTGSSKLIKFQNSDYYGLFYHDSQNKNSQSSSYEYFAILKDKGEIVKTEKLQNKLFQTKSAVALKNGKIFMAGIAPISTNYAETSIRTYLYDPDKEEWQNGLSFAGHSKYVSCYEQKKDNLYCVYVSYDDAFITKLKIKHLYVNDNTLVEKEEKVIKTFYTEFNFLKAVPYNEKEAVILFQVGNNEKIPQLGNTGQDLYFYQIELSDTEFVVAKRYELLSQSCKYVKDPEEYNADIIVLTKNRIYAVCEAEDKEFKGFEIHPHEKPIIKFDIYLAVTKAKSPAFGKFKNTLALFYNNVKSNLNSQTVYSLINYPDCHDYRSKDDPLILPKRFSKEIDLSGKIFIANPLPANRAGEEILFRIGDSSNMTIIKTDTNENLLENKDYNIGYFKISTDSLEGDYTLEFTATKDDDFDGLIIGRTCKIYINTPKCLPQCYTCTKTGTNEHHYCLGCAEGSYYEEEDDTTENDGYGKPHNCKKCNKACQSCYGPLLNKPVKTTNCKKCDYEKGFYHYIDDERTCISKDTQEEWEEYYNISIYLDDSEGEDQKDKWRWRHCHKNCKKCHGPGTDEDNQCDECNNGLYFYCNQTIGHGIPGSCHDKCVNHGFYIHKNASDNMDKCCPCLDNCLVCNNASICEECKDTFYKTPEWDRCNKTCNSCLAYDDELKECVFCKTRYEKTGQSPRYHYKRKCVYPMPNGYHKYEDVCYNITICDDSCLTCEPEGSGRCTKCSPNYFREDFFGLPKPDTFRCFNTTNCVGKDMYKTKDEELWGGGVLVQENGEGVCLNCKLRNNSYRQPEDQYYCGDKIPHTFVDIIDYNKLTKCYTRCKECDGWGHACLMNCTKCLDAAHYDLIKYDATHGNCYRKAHKCGIYPYYHDYDIAEKIGKSEDNCGEDCDVCLYNFSCIEAFPYFNLETHECVEYCPITKVLGNECSLNHSASVFSLLKNPFGTRNPYDFINSTVSIKQLLSGDLYKYISNVYKIDQKTTETMINNFLESGKIFNLPESQIIVGNNVSIEITTGKLEQEKVGKIMKEDTEEQTKTSILDLSECEAILKKKYGISEEEELMYIKGELLKNFSDYFGNEVDYVIFSTSLGCFLPLSACQEEEVSVTVTNPFSTQNLIMQFQSKIEAVVSNGYDVFDSSSPFYNDVCAPFTNENGNDVLLEQRRSDYFNENINLCEPGCTFDSYNLTLKMYTCTCPIKTDIGAELESNEKQYKEVSKNIPESFYKKHKHSNIEVFKCSSQVFSVSGQTKNFGSYCLLICFASFVGVVAFYFIKGKESVKSLFQNISIASPPNPRNNEKGNYDPLKKKPKPNPPFYENFTHEQLLTASFSKASEKDKRNYIQTYWSLLKMKQLFIFTFYTYTDYNLRIVKIALFILFVSFYFAFTALFFNDSIMREIYTYKGNTNAAVHIPNIILSSLCCIIMNFIVRFISLSERDISKINNTKVPDERKKLSRKIEKIYKIKLYVLFALSSILIALCWYYVAAFCAVFKNSQGHYFLNLLIAFIVCNTWPCITSLIPAIIRVKALHNQNECMYKFSQIISYI
jgi:ABC-type multidrug transport system fused ATPase/permease subunit